MENTGTRASIRWRARCIRRKEDFTDMYSFDRQYYQKRLKRDEIGVAPVPRFYRPKVEQEYSTRDRRLHLASLRYRHNSKAFTEGQLTGIGAEAN